MCNSAFARARATAVFHKMILGVIARNTNLTIQQKGLIESQFLYDLTKWQFQAAKWKSLPMAKLVNGKTGKWKNWLMAKLANGKTSQ